MPLGLKIDMFLFCIVHTILERVIYVLRVDASVKPNFRVLLRVCLLVDVF